MRDLLNNPKRSGLTVPRQVERRRSLPSSVQLFFPPQFVDPMQEVLLSFG
jgi:hypothetical protein